MRRSSSLRLACVIPLLSAQGCIAHVARVQPCVWPEAGTETTVVAGTKRADPAAPHVTESPLPIEMHISAWHKQADGPLERAETDLRTPLPWWQRFPFDAAADFAPTRLTAQSEAAVVFTPVPSRDEADLFKEAQSNGFAHDSDEH
jgi:hypothetical protein